jgi:Co/Zn/Cd efflux system component
MMVGTMIFSLKSLKLSQKPKDDSFNFGYRRFNILAAFFNSVYLIFTFIFDVVDNLHHLAENIG